MPWGLVSVAVLMPVPVRPSHEWHLLAPLCHGLPGESNGSSWRPPGHPASVCLSLVGVICQRLLFRPNVGFPLVLWLECPGPALLWAALPSGSGRPRADVPLQADLSPLEWLTHAASCLAAGVSDVHLHAGLSRAAPYVERRLSVPARQVLHPHTLWDPSSPICVLGVSLFTAVPVGLSVPAGHSASVMRKGIFGYGRAVPGGV